MSVHWAIVISDEIFGDLNCMMVAQDCERGSQYLRGEVRNRIKKQTLAATCLDFEHGFVGVVWIVGVISYSILASNRKGV